VTSARPYRGWDVSRVGPFHGFHSALRGPSPGPRARQAIPSHPSESSIRVVRARPASRGAEGSGAQCPVTREPLPPRWQQERRARSGARRPSLLLLLLLRRRRLLLLLLLLLLFLLLLLLLLLADDFKHEREVRTDAGRKRRGLPPLLLRDASARAPQPRISRGAAGVLGRQCAASDGSQDHVVVAFEPGSGVARAVWPKGCASGFRSRI
jgi:hypothetical protein